MVSGKSWWDGKCYHDCVAPKELVEAGGGVSVDWEYANPPHLTSDTRRSFQNVDAAMDACCSELLVNATAGPGRVRAAEVAYYSETAEGIISCDKSQLKRYRGIQPPKSYNLNRGYEDWRKLTRKAEGEWQAEGKGNIETRTIAASLRTIRPSLSTLDFSVVSRRGNISKLLAAPYASSSLYDYLEILVCRVDNTLFFQSRRVDRDDTAFDDIMYYRGFHYESCCTAPYKPLPVPVGNTFTSLVALDLGEHRILVAAETDAIDEKAGQYVEMKLTYDSPPDKLNTSKYPRYWLQCFSGGVKEVVVGYRNSGGKVVANRTLKTCQLLDKSSWDSKVCTSFLSFIIHWLFENIQNSKETHLLVIDPTKRNETTMVNAVLHKDPDNTLLFPAEPLFDELFKE
eukprot:GHVS01075588.1.p1 GENE.GHVS01075588.1~~GHVS01075588.1.p1  ORF type:complete len:399 (+),score=26.74 GHVS01075588.1:138-1334(+)